MTLLDHGQPADTPTKKHRTGLIAVLAIVAVTLLAVGAWLFVDRQQPFSTEQTPSSTEQQPQFTEQQAAIMEVVTAHNDAINARDRDALRATITDDFTWGSIPADDYVAIVATKGADETEAFTGDPVFSGDLQVAIPTHREPGGVWEDGTPVVMDGTYTFTLREVDGQLKIATIVFAETSVNFPGASSGSTS